MHDDRYLYLVKKLIRKTKKIGNCFIWIGYTNDKGYGMIPLGHNRSGTRAHKLAAHLFRDIPLYDGFLTLHKPNCVSRACWNPEHTYEGTQEDNIRDAIRAGTHISWIRRQHGWR